MAAIDFQPALDTTRAPLARHHSAVSTLAHEPLLSINGHVPTEQHFSLAELKAMPRQTLGPVDVACMTGRPVARIESYAGVLLTDVLDTTGLSSLHRAELKRCVVIASGDDGYQAIFSWCELYISPVGAQVLVLFEREQEPLDGSGGHMGELSLISAADTHLGPRHLRHLRSIMVRML